ncbi:MAG: YdcF family protein [Clostridia bacterium]|nr:YdcF family protein [Clostridia bacterium]
MRRYDAILLLGLKLNDDGSPRHELSLRIETAAKCYHRGLAPLIIPCGGRTPDTPCSEAEVMREALISLGVPEKAIRCEDKSQITVENFFNARALLSVADPRVLIVTSDYHMLRSRLICRFSAHMRCGGCKARIPHSEVRAARRKEPLHLIDYLLGYQTGRRPRPEAYKRFMYRLLDRIH